MTKEEKELLLKDLCPRLPYGVIVSIKEVDSDRKPWFGELSCKDLDCFIHNVVYESIKPYLRPMSSMTEEEMDELYTAMDWYGEIDETGNVYTKGQEKVYRETFYEYTDWLNSHHFDFRGLISKDLALEAPEDMYEKGGSK